MGDRPRDVQSARHVLVVDDDETFLDFMATLLRSEGYAVEVAASVAEAEAKLRGARPDVLMSDLWMVGEPPFALLDRLTALPDAADLPVILCTAAVHEVEAATAWLAGRRVEVLLKPFDIEEVFACLERLR